MPKQARIKTADEMLKEELDRTFKEKKLKIHNPKSVRNLQQYKHLTDEEFDNRYSQIMLGVEKNQALEERIVRKRREFEEAYDLSDLKPNDEAVLRSLIQAILRLEDYEQVLSTMSNEVNYETITVVEKLNSAADKLRTSISSMQNDLQISRKIRNESKQESIVNYIDTLKEKARKFYNSRTQMIFCPKCNTLLAQVWWLYPDYNNRITLKCHRQFEDNSVCDGEVSLTSKELLELGSTNYDGIPDSMK